MPHSFVSRNHATLSVIAIVLGIAWVLIFPLACVTCGEAKCRGVYVSENALMPDGAPPSFGAAEIQSARLCQQRYQKALNAQINATAPDDGTEFHIEFLRNQLEGVGESSTLHVQRSRGFTNLYAILPAKPLNDGKESMVLTVLYRRLSPASFEDSSLSSASSICLGIALYKHFSAARWSSKDFILLLADGDAGVQRWLEAYHSDPLSLSGPGQAGLQLAHAGSIRAAVVLDATAATSLDSIVVTTQGINGRLPNLDLFNSLQSTATLDIELSLEYQSDSVLRGRAERWLEDNMIALAPAHVRSAVRTPLTRYLLMLSQMLRFIVDLAQGHRGPHSHFLAYNIDAITVYTNEFTYSPTQAYPSAYLEVGRAMELVFRSMSNLEEKLHQSYFLYLLPSPSHFVSIDEYAPALLLLCSPLPLALVAHWDVSSRQLSFAIASLVACVTSGAAWLVFTLRLYLRGPVSDEVLWTSINALSLLHLFMPAALHVGSRCWPGSKTRSQHGARPIGELWRAVTAVLNFYLFCSLGVMGFLNFGVALLTAVVSVPVCCTLAPARQTSFPMMFGLARPILLLLQLLVTAPLPLLLLVSWLSGQADSSAPGLVKALLNSHVNVQSFNLLYLAVSYVPVHMMCCYVFIFGGL